MHIFWPYFRVVPQKASLLWPLTLFSSVPLMTLLRVVRYALGVCNRLQLASLMGHLKACKVETDALEYSHGAA